MIPCQVFALKRFIRIRPFCDQILRMCLLQEPITFIGFRFSIGLWAFLLAYSIGDIFRGSTFRLYVFLSLLLMSFARCSKYIFSQLIPSTEMLNCLDSFLIIAARPFQDIGNDVCEINVLDGTVATNEVVLHVIACLADTCLTVSPEIRQGMITVAKKVLSITDEEIDALADELSKMYPAGYVDYYAGCIYAMQERMKMI